MIEIPVTYSPGRNFNCMGNPYTAILVLVPISTDSQMT